MVHKHEVPVLSFISDCVSMFSAQAREGGVTVSFAGCSVSDGVNSDAMLLDENDSVFIDRFKMDQVLRNLISNALKFTPRGGSVTVTANFIPDSSCMCITGHDEIPPESLQSTSPMSSPSRVFSNLLSTPTRMGLLNQNRFDTSPVSVTNTSSCLKGKLVIVVKDTGSGMIEKDYSRLFNEIVQFNPEVLQAGGGSGLGLWITKGIVDLHQGDISVYSEGLGCGSSFTVELPMERKISDLSATLLSSSLEEDCFLSSRDTMIMNATGTEMSIVALEALNKVESVNLAPIYQLLIVDDSPLNRKMLLRTFRLAGHICDEAEDGVIAVAKVKEMMSSSAKAYSAILMDFVMPNMDGPTATKEIRSLGYTAPIFGVTGNTLDSDVGHFLQNGANRVLAKPFDINAFNTAMIAN